MCVAALIAPAPAAADHVGVFLTSSFSPESFADRGAVGLLVPGKGPTVTREETLELLDWGDLGTPACANRRPCPIEIFIPEPPPGEYHNVRRLPIAIVGGGYRGLLVSDATRIPGLVAISDVPATVRALERADNPVIESRPAADAPERLARLDRRLTRAHDSRTPAMVSLVGLLLVLAALAALFRSRLLGRAALLAAPASLLTALALSALEVDRPLVVALVLLVAAGSFSLAGAALLSRRGLGLALVSVLAVYLVVMAAWPEVNSLASIGPHPDGGGRFYGVTNQLGTLLLAPSLLGAALLGRRALLPVALLAILTVGTSRTGADGGGMLVLAAAFLVLAARLIGLRLTPLRVAVGAAATVALGLIAVAIDAGLGGSSHVTRTVTGGPDSIADAIGHRFSVSFDGATGSWHAAAIIALSLAALAWLATREPRSAVLDALLAGLVVSLVVNDTPLDVAAFGALTALAVWSWQRGDLPADLRPHRL